MSTEIGYAVKTYPCQCDRPAEEEMKKIFEFIKPDGRIMYKCGIGSDDCLRIDEIRRNTNSILRKPEK